MSSAKTVATGADWTQLLADPDLVSHLGKLLQICREASPDKREKALFEAIREIKSGKAESSAATDNDVEAAPVEEPQVPATVTAPPFEPDIFTPSWGEDRRRHPRMKCFVAVELKVDGNDAPIWGNLSNTSIGGGLVETPTVIDTGKKIEVGLWVANGKIWVKGVILNGVVTGTTRSRAVRIKFAEMPSAEKEILRQFLKFVENTTKSYSADYGYLAQLKR